MAALRQVFVRLGFSQDAARSIVEDQGIDSLDEINFLCDKQIKLLCYVVRRPGGTVANPNAEAGGTVNNPGVQVSVRAENNMKLAAYYIRHRRHRISRSVEPPDVTLENCRTMINLRDYEVNNPSPETPPTADLKDWVKTMDTLNEYLTVCRGDRNIPLAYVVRTEVEAPDEATDPSTNYTTSAAEMIARAPHGADNETYEINNGKVLEILSGMFRDTTAWTYIKPFVATKDGRGAYFAVFGHYLGEDSVDNQAHMSEKALATLNYNGEGRRWNFETYVTAMKKHHQILEGLVDHGYAGIDERSKVRHFLNGLKSPALEVPKSTIISDHTYRNDFDKCVGFIKTFIDQTDAAKAPSTRNISEIAHVQHEKCEDRYYSKDEYRNLTPGQKAYLRQLRDGRGHKRGSRSSRVPEHLSKKQKTQPADKKTLKGLTRTIAAMGKSIESLQSQLKDKDDSVPETVSTDGSNGSNRNNAALTRQSN